MPIQRVFIDWNQPALAAAADYLLDRYNAPGIADLGGVIVVLPGRRAGRRLLELIVDRAAERKLLLTPPVIETVGALPEQLYRPQRPFASELTQRFAWAAALQAAEDDQLRPFIARPPAADDESAWLELGEMIRRQHVELAGDDLDFSSVVDCAAELGGVPERQRWQALAAIQAEYHRRLDELQLWDRQTARRVAIRQGECRIERDVVLVATVDMNRTTRRMLDAVDDRVTSLVFAGDESEWIRHFDELGCLEPLPWQDLEIPVDPGQVEIVNGPADQAAAILRKLASYDGQFRATNVTVGFPDDRLAPRVQRLLEAADLPARWGPGKPCAESGPYRLLEGLAPWIASDRYEEFAALARHPDLGDWLTSRGVDPDWLVELDAYQAEHLPDRLSGNWLGRKSDTHQLRRAERQLRKLTKALRGKPRPIGNWVQPILDLLVSIYGDRDWDREQLVDHEVLTACQHLRDAALELAETRQELAPAVSATDALRLVLAQVADAAIPPRGGDPAIELLGWLELPLDDAPALIVTSVNEGFVPASVTSDLFLPNAVRDRLGLLNNARRYARDAYAMRWLLASDRNVHWIAARRNRDGDPLFPSRLLMAVRGTALAERALAFFQPPPSITESPAFAQPQAGSAEPSFAIPRPSSLPAAIERLSVTGFRDYLACPFRFYLRHILRLGMADDHARELDPSGFGSLAHETLRQFGRSETRDSTNADEIERFLNEALDEYVAASFGDHVAPMVHVQVAQLRLRLAAFARQQAQWRAAGWRIELTEAAPPMEGAPLMVDGLPCALSGRIDRIDIHPDGRIAVLDYKTSDAGDPPEKTHQKGGVWTDLQLPLYRHLATSVLANEALDCDAGSPLLLGYATMPKDVSRTGFQIAEWTAVQLAEADDVAAQVVRAVRNQVFWPPADPPPPFSEDFAAICQDGVFGKEDVFTMET